MTTDIIKRAAIIGIGLLRAARAQSCGYVIAAAKTLVDSAAAGLEAFFEAGVGAQRRAVAS